MATPAELQKILKQRRTWQKSESVIKHPVRVQFRPAVKTRDVTDFTRQLSTMMAARLPLARSLEVLEKQQKNPRFRDMIHEILQLVRSGKSLSESLSRYPKQFSPLYLNMLTVGEISGNMPELLEQLAVYLEKMGDLRRKLFTAMTYPAVIVLVAIGAFTFLMFGVMPTFTDMFQDFGRNMPLPAQLLMNTGDFIKSHVLLILLSLILVVGILRVFVRSEKGKWIIDVLKLKIPLIGQIVKKVSVSRFARTLGTLLQSGVSLLEALHVTSQSSGNRVFQKQILRMKEMAERGEAMEKSIAGSDLFPELVVQMISVGEETAELPGMLTRTAEFYETEVDAAIEALTSIIEPVIIVVLGIVLGGMMITIYMQIFDLMNVIQ